MPPLTQAGIPYVGGLALGAAELTAPNSLQSIGSSPSALASLSTFIAQDLQAKKVGDYIVEIPAGRVAAETFGKMVMNNLGVTDVSLVSEPPTAADLTASLTKAKEGNPDAICALRGLAVHQGHAGRGCAGDPRREAGLHLRLQCTTADRRGWGGRAERLLQLAVPGHQLRRSGGCGLPGRPWRSMPRTPTPTG